MVVRWLEVRRVALAAATAVWLLAKAGEGSDGGGGLFGGAGGRPGGPPSQHFSQPRMGGSSMPYDYPTNPSRLPPGAGSGRLPDSLQYDLFGGPPLGLRGLDGGGGGGGGGNSPPPPPGFGPNFGAGAPPSAGPEEFAKAYTQSPTQPPQSLGQSPFQSLFGGGGGGAAPGGGGSGGGSWGAGSSPAASGGGGGSWGGGGGGGGGGWGGGGGSGSSWGGDGASQFSQHQPPSGLPSFGQQQQQQQQPPQQQPPPPFGQSQSFGPTPEPQTQWQPQPRFPPSPKASAEMPLPAPPAASVFTLHSPEFEDSGCIPTTFGCSASDRDWLKPSVPLSWDNPPDGTQSFVLVVDDVTPSAHDWVHWFVADIPQEVRGFTEGTSRSSPDLPVTEYTNTWGVHGFGGFCPPGDETHAYRFRMFARSTPTTSFASETEGTLNGPDRLHAIVGALKDSLGTAELTGRYAASGKCGAVASGQSPEPAAPLPELRQLLTQHGSLSSSLFGSPNKAAEPSQQQQQQQAQQQPQQQAQQQPQQPQQQQQPQSQQQWQQPQQPQQQQQQFESPPPPPQFGSQFHEPDNSNPFLQQLQQMARSQSQPQQQFSSPEQSPLNLNGSPQGLGGVGDLSSNPFLSALTSLGQSQAGGSSDPNANPLLAALGAFQQPQQAAVQQDQAALPPQAGAGGSGGFPGLFGNDADNAAADSGSGGGGSEGKDARHHSHGHHSHHHHHRSNQPSEVEYSL